MCQPFDLNRLEITGEALAVAQDVPRIFPATTRAGAFSVSANGTLVYRSGNFESGRSRLVWIDRAGRDLANPWGNR